jgi:hypothetical protein
LHGDYTAARFSEAEKHKVEKGKEAAEESCKKALFPNRTVPMTKTLPNGKRT